MIIKRILFITIFIFLSQGVWGKQVSFSDLVIREGLYYKKFSDDAFTGSIDDYHSLSEDYLRGEIIKGKPEGQWTKWYKNGQLKEKYNMKNGEFDGDWTSWYKNGQIKERINYKKGKRVGFIKEFFENGNIKRRIQIKDDRKDGLFEEYYENGNIKSKGYKKVFKKLGKWEFYNEDGTLKMVEEYWVKF